MKIATWNVNGIRAREAQFCEWLERDQPDVVCLQELKADPSQIPERCTLADYHVIWHGHRGYSGVSLHIRKNLVDVGPEFIHPEFDMETRIVQTTIGNTIFASVYVPNGGKDYAAKIGFLTCLVAWAKRLHDEGREVVLCGDINIAHTDIDVHPKERKVGVIGQRPEERELFDRLLGEHFVDVGRALQPDLVAAVAQHAPTQHRVAHRLHTRIAKYRGPGDRMRRACRCGNERSCTGDDDHHIANGPGCCGGFEIRRGRT